MSLPDAPTPAPSQPVCLSIAGSDSGCGAGIQADLKTFQAFGCFGTTAITATTAQNPAGVSSVHAIPPDHVADQIRAVTAAFSIGATKTGMLFSAAIIDAVTAAIGSDAAPPRHLIVDPVMVATSGACLLQADAIDALRHHLLPRATLVTPNLPEAAILAGVDSIDTLAAAEATACRLRDTLGVAILIKGGHSPEGSLVDVLATRDAVYLLDAPRLRALSTHGTGCTLSAAIAAGLATGRPLLDAIADAKAYVWHAIAYAHQVGPATYAMRPDPDWTRDVIEISKR